MEAKKPRRMEISKHDSRPYPLLCQAVVVRACQDYRNALRQKKRQTYRMKRVDGRTKDIGYSTVDADYNILECERFFRNELSLYSDLDGEWIIKQIRGMVRNE